MRLRSATIEGFRGFVKKAEIDLDADVIILQGPNGVGKTSLLDAILWALTGRIDRFRDRGSPISLYAREGIARVVLVVKDGDSDFVVTRATDGDRDSIRIRSADAELEGAAAESRLSEHLLPHLRERAQAAAALSNVLTRGVYLQQDLVRQFVESDTAAERFGLISEVIGAGIVLELQSALEKAAINGLATRPRSGSLNRCCNNAALSMSSDFGLTPNRSMKPWRPASARRSCSKALSS